MTSIPPSTSVVTSEGRVTIPAGIRRELGVSPGDRVAFVRDLEGNYRIVPARSLLEAIWAQNLGGDGGDAEADVREIRSGAVTNHAAYDADGPIDVEQEYAQLAAALGLRS